MSREIQPSRHDPTLPRAEDAGRIPNNQASISNARQTMSMFPECRDVLAIIDENANVVAVEPLLRLALEGVEPSALALPRSVTAGQRRERTTRRSRSLAVCIGRVARAFPAQSRMQAYPTADGGPYPARDLEGPTSTIHDVTLAIDYRRLANSGRVVDGAGAPVADAEVHALATAGTQAPPFQPWLRLRRTFTGVDGTFTVSELAPGA